MFVQLYKSNYTTVSNKSIVKKSTDLPECSSIVHKMKYLFEEVHLFRRKPFLMLYFQFSSDYK